MLFLFN